MKILVLEDNPQRISHFCDLLHGASTVIVQNAEDACHLLESITFDAVFLDHDLGGEVYVNSEHENCGMRVADYIVDNDIVIDSVVIHSWNSNGADNMYNRLKAKEYLFNKLRKIKFGKFDRKILWN